MRYDGIDRVSPTRRPEATPLLHQNWEHLLFVHWEVDPEKLRALIPDALELDLFDGKAFVGLVPFTLSGVRPILTPPLPLLSSFHEVNVRTYVHHKGKNPGVWFFSLDASSSIAVAAARAAYKLPYFAAQIEFDVDSTTTPSSIRFHSSRKAGDQTPANCLAEYAAENIPPRAAEPGTLDHFLIERYILYAHSENQLYRARVHHAPYPVQKAAVHKLEETILWAAGIQHKEKPDTLHYAREVKVEVFLLEKV